MVFSGLNPDRGLPYELEITGILTNGSNVQLKRDVYLGNTIMPIIMDCYTESMMIISLVFQLNPRFRACTNLEPLYNLQNLICPLFLNTDTISSCLVHFINNGTTVIEEFEWEGIGLGALMEVEITFLCTINGITFYEECKWSYLCVKFIFTIVNIFTIL